MHFLEEVAKYGFKHNLVMLNPKDVVTKPKFASFVVKKAIKNGHRNVMHKLNLHWFTT